jgi:hypothetical protein
MQQSQAIFISYRRSDAAGHARALHRDFCRCFASETIFFDRQSIESGDVFPETLRYAVGKCQVMLVLIGPEWLQAKNAAGLRRLEDPQDFVRQEIAQALNLNKKIIPVLFDEMRMPAASELPEGLKPLALCDALPLRGKAYEYEVQLSELVRLVAKVEGVPKPALPFKADMERVQSNVISHPYFPAALVDQKIEQEIDIVRKSRFFVEFETVSVTITLAARLAKGELSIGTDFVRAKALAWCTRILSPTEEMAAAEEHLKLAKTLGSCPEIDIADAFIISQKGYKRDALAALARIDLPISRSAALMVVAHHEDPQATVEWMKSAGIDAKSLDPDGKYFLLTRFFGLSQWDKALECSDVVRWPPSFGRFFDGAKL